MKDIISTIKFITILGLTTIILLGCVRKQPEPVAKENKYITSDGKYIGPGGYAIDLKEQDKQLESEGKYLQCMQVAKLLPADDRLKYLRECGAID